MKLAHSNAGPGLRRTRGRCAADEICVNQPWRVGAEAGAGWEGGMGLGEGGVGLGEGGMGGDGGEGELCQQSCF